MENTSKIHVFLQKDPDCPMNPQGGSSVDAAVVFVHQKGTQFRRTVSLFRLRILLGTAAAARAGFLFRAFFRVGTADTGRAAFLFPVQVEHYACDDTQYDYDQYKINHCLLFQCVLRFPFLISIVDDDDDYSSHCQNCNQTCKRCNNI